MSLGDHAPFFEAPVVLQGLFTKRMPHEEEVDFTLLSPLVLYHQLHVCMDRCVTKWKERNEQKQQTVNCAYYFTLKELLGFSCNSINVSSTDY